MEQKEQILEKLCEEIAVITNRDAGEISRTGTLRENGIDSMSFLELLLFMKREWKVDFMNIGTAHPCFASMEALAGEIQSRCK